MTTPRRILVLNERDPAHPRAGGAEVHVAEIFSRLAERGHTVVQYSSGFPGAAPSSEDRGVRIERHGGLARYYASVPARVRRRSVSSGGPEFDVIVECLNKVPFYAPLYARVPVLALCHHLFGEVAFEQVPWPIAAGVFLAERGLPWAYRDCRFVAISESSREDLITRGLEATRIELSHPGVEPPRKTDGSPRIPEVESPRPQRITYLGRLEPYKRIDVLLRAGAILRDRFPDLEIVVIGRGSARASLEALAKQLDLTDRTRFTGFVEDAERDDWLAESAACVFPSPKEGWGLTVIEANALGTPVVARNAPGLRDSVRHHETGLLVPTDEPNDFARALAFLLREDEAVREMRRAALAWARRFDWDRAALDMEAAIERRLAEASA